MLAAIAIKNHVQYNSYIQKTSGYVNLGGVMDETAVAMDVLVFMVVGKQDHYKAPVTCYLAKSRSPDRRKGPGCPCSEGACCIGVVRMTIEGNSCQCQHGQPAKRTWVIKNFLYTSSDYRKGVCVFRSLVTCSNFSHVQICTPLEKSASQTLLNSTMYKGWWTACSQKEDKQACPLWGPENQGVPGCKNTESLYQWHCV